MGLGFGFRAEVIIRVDFLQADVSGEFYSSLAVSSE